MNAEIREILTKAIDTKRWADKTNTTYTFLDEEEIKEMVENIIKKLYAEGYVISKNYIIMADSDFKNNK
mgnify:CR=1 FL=1|jgi:hypothetical protein